MADSATHALRPLRPDDLDRVVEIDHRSAGRPRRVFFEKRLEAALADPERFVAVAAGRTDGSADTADGFAIARVQAGEFGDEYAVAILDVIGVDPDVRGKGLGQLLMDGVDKFVAKRGVREVRTQAAWSEQDMIGFFAAAGFSLAPRQVLERSTSRNFDV